MLSKSLQRAWPTAPMKIMQWPAEYEAIMWEAVMMEAKARWEKASQ